MARIPKVLDPEELAARHVAGESITAIARDVGVHNERVEEALKSTGVEIRRNLWGPHHPRWNGGRFVTHYGYIKVTLPYGHLYREMADVNGGVYEHRLVMAMHLERPLRQDETVHHVDGDKSNNAITNLQLRIGAHGQGVVAACDDCGSQNIVMEAL